MGHVPVRLSNISKTRNPATATTEVMVVIVVGEHHWRFLRIRQKFTKSTASAMS